MITTNDDADFPKKESLQKDEKGIVSIVVTLLIMAILTLIVTGFAQLARREQREALDRQLASQANYAAETGINDARRALLNSAFSGQKDDCGPVSRIHELSNNNLGDNVSYSCLLINQKLKNTLSNVSTDKSTVEELHAVSSTPTPLTNLDQVLISWKSVDGSSGIPSNFGQFPASGSWGPNIGILRLDIIPYNPTNFNSIGLKQAAYTVFLYPSSVGTTPSYSSALRDQGQVIKAQCTGGLCKMSITGLTSVDYIVRLKSIYKDSTVSICAGTCDGTILFKGSQTEIDSTGKAGDVLKRLKVRIPKNPGNAKKTPADFTLDSSESICKESKVTPTTFDKGTCPTY
ncbi:MAG: pilus assembly PilX N-terminal domain-containing protein [Candidatus Saccharibacteria bacterium]|nr:pilus assembly PilX N-terminal domain-containing protein [Candidatus Saccharibacteria bacterium]